MPATFAYIIGKNASLRIVDLYDSEALMTPLLSNYPHTCSFLAILAILSNLDASQDLGARASRWNAEPGPLPGNSVCRCQNA